MNLIRRLKRLRGQGNTWQFIHKRSKIKITFVDHNFYSLNLSIEHSQLLIKEKLGLSKDEGIPSHLIPTTFKEETYIIEDEGILMLKQVYFSSYWQLRKNILDLVEDSLSQDSLIGSTISAKSRGKDISCASKFSSPIMMSHDTKSSKVSRESKIANFYLKNLNHAFTPKPNFEECRRE